MSAATDWTRLPLAGHGRSLVEASAGTGKTWTLASLYLRLVLEEQRAPAQIVVSTFTNAAADELRERLRARLLDALALASQAVAAPVTVPVDSAGDGGMAPAADVAWLHGRWDGDPVRVRADARRLDAALAQFDAAPVGTLHALCSLILAEHPFAAGAPFRSRELVDGDTLVDALADDLWRLLTQADDDAPLVQLAAAAGMSRAAIRGFLPCLLRSGTVVAFMETVDLTDVFDRLDFLADRRAWAQSARVIAEECTTTTSKLRRAWLALADAIEQPGAVDGAALAPAVACLAKATGLVGVKPTCQDRADVRALALQSERIAAALPRDALDLCCGKAQRRFLEAVQAWGRSALQQRLDAANQSTFDQLIEAVRLALTGPGGRALADALFATWPVALVDEFQDTDPLQFSILDAIYRDADGNPRGRLLMIGDPKQAIYRFRGGDIHAYRRARAQAQQGDRLVLGANHRSSSGYVQAINQLFGAGAGTALQRLEYRPVAARGRADGHPYVDARGDAIEQPLVLDVLATDGSDDDGDLADRALQACAGQVTQLLADGGSIGARRIVPGDIAVLLPGNADIVRLQQLLHRRGVPSVALARNSVFAAPIARDLRLLLHAALHASDPRVVRAALATPLLGGTLSALQQVADDPAAWNAQAARFHAWGQQLERGGPLAVVTAVLAERAGALLAASDGERALTDLRHLGELLQDAWDANAGGEQLLAWFARQVDGDEGDAGDIRALRLESDAARVRLMTLHASKGLEFPIVHLPLMWKQARGRRAKDGPQLLAHAGGAGDRIMLECGKALVAADDFDERMRLLYVALTRAVHACHVFLLPGDHPRARPGEVPIASLPLDVLRRDATRIAFRSGWQSRRDVRFRRNEADAAQRMARPMPPARTGPLPMRHSFSTLAGMHGSSMPVDERSADDEIAAIMFPEDDAAGTGAPREAAADRVLLELAPLRGTEFGNAVHAVFEHRQPRVPLAAGQVRAALQEYAVRPRLGEAESFVQPLAARLQAVLETPLGGPGGPRLFDLASHQMRAELEFHYVLDGARLQRLREACQRHGEPGLAPAGDGRLAGLMTGKIDLVFQHDGRFHVLDYKGNQLSDPARPVLADYAPTALESAMAAHGYRLQALLYTVAVDRYLRGRLGAAYRRAEHLGDCWYLFIRAVGLSLPDGTPCGVWRHRYAGDLLDAVQDVLDEGAGR